MILDLKRPPISELVGDEPYTYYPLGNYVVRAIGVCGGRPTFKYTRIEVSQILAFIAAGESVADIVEDYEHPHLTAEAIQEALQLANSVFSTSTLATKPLAV